MQSLITRINSELYLEEKQKAFKLGKHESLLRIIDLLKGISEALCERISEIHYWITCNPVYEMNEARSRL